MNFGFSFCFVFWAKINSAQSLVLALCSRTIHDGALGTVLGAKFETGPVTYKSIYSLPTQLSFQPPLLIFKPNWNLNKNQPPNILMNFRHIHHTWTSVISQHFNIERKKVSKTETV